MVVRIGRRDNMKVSTCKDCKNGEKKQIFLSKEEKHWGTFSRTGMWCYLNNNWCRNVTKDKCSFE
jgi:hypothetical protein